MLDKQSRRDALQLGQVVSTPNGPGMSGLKDYEDKLKEFWEPNMETARWIPTHICIVCCDTGFTDFNGVSTACTECAFGAKALELGDTVLIRGTNVIYTKDKPMNTIEPTKCNPQGYANHECPSCKPESKDPWQHRARYMRCYSCMAFVAKGDGPSQSDPTKKQLGRCRRHAPQLEGFPTMFSTDWCLDHKLDETKL